MSFFRFEEVKYLRIVIIHTKPRLETAIQEIKKDLKSRLEELTTDNKLLEHHVLKREQTDLEMIKATGTCSV